MKKLFLNLLIVFLANIVNAQYNNGLNSQTETELKRQLEITSSAAFKEKFIEALANIKENKNIEAITILNQLISKAPDVLSLLYYHRGSCYFKLKKYNEVIADMNVFIKKHSSGVDKCFIALGYFYRGASYRVLDEVDKACEDGKLAKSFGCTEFTVDDLTLFQMCNSNNQATVYNQKDSPVSNHNSSQTCYSCSGTGKCRQCNKVFKNHYWGGKYKGWKSDSETRLGYVMCSECKGSGVKYGLMDDNNEPTSKPCYLSSCNDGWIYCTECNYNGNGTNLGSCKKCKGSGTSK